MLTELYAQWYVSQSLSDDDSREGVGDSGDLSETLACQNGTLAGREVHAIVNLNSELLTVTEDSLREVPIHTELQSGSIGGGHRGREIDRRAKETTGEGLWHVSHRPITHSTRPVGSVDGVTIIVLQSNDVLEHRRMEDPSSAADDVGIDLELESNKLIERHCAVVRGSNRGGERGVLHNARERRSSREALLVLFLSHGLREEFRENRLDGDDGVGVQILADRIETDESLGVKLRGAELDVGNVLSDRTALSEPRGRGATCASRNVHLVAGHRHNATDLTSNRLLRDDANNVRENLIGDEDTTLRLDTLILRGTSVGLIDLEAHALTPSLSEDSTVGVHALLTGAGSSGNEVLVTGGEILIEEVGTLLKRGEATKDLVLDLAIILCGLFDLMLDFLDNVKNAVEVAALIDDFSHCVTPFLGWVCQILVLRQKPPSFDQQDPTGPLQIPYHNSEKNIV